LLGNGSVNTFPRKQIHNSRGTFGSGVFYVVYAEGPVSPAGSRLLAGSRQPARIEAAKGISVVTEWHVNN
jgi:hypothetical protein